MSNPIVFISRNRVKEGMAEAFREFYRDSVPLVENSKPGTLVQIAYLSEDNGEVVVVRLFPSAEALDQQLHGADTRSKKAYDFIEPIAVEVYGTPSDNTLVMIEKAAGSGIPVNICAHYLGGFMRLKSILTDR